MNTKKTIILLLLALAGVQGFAQRFDWVKSYSGQDPAGRNWNFIASSATDSHGNLYVAGLFANGASIDGQELLPFIPYGNSSNSCIMKISPDGDILWKKILHASQERPTHIYEIQLVGDSALWANAVFSIPRLPGEYLYFYDTLITQDNLDYLLYMDSISSGAVTTSLSCFDLDGNLTENYFLTMAYKDNHGKLITLGMMTGNAFDTAYIADCQFKPGSFHVDDQGNIYFQHMTDDHIIVICDTCEYGFHMCNLGDGTLSEAIIMVNGRQRFSHALTTPVATYNYRIMKFAPHMTDMLECRYVFTHCGGNWTAAYSRKIITSPDGSRVYFLVGLQDPSSVMDVTLQGDTSKYVSLNRGGLGFVIEYDDHLTPLDVIQVTPQETPSNVIATNMSFYNVIIPADSSDLFIVGTLAKNHVDFTPTYRDQSFYLGDAQSNAFVLRVGTGDNPLKNHNHIRTSKTTSFLTEKGIMGLAASNGRLFAQSEYRGNIQWLDTGITIAASKYGSGAFIWDYSLRELGFVDMDMETSGGTVASSLAAHDSSLYIMVSAKESFSLSGTPIPCPGSSVAVIARYVNSSFATPYSHGGDHDESVSRPEIRRASLFPNPTNSTVNISLPIGETAATCTVISASGMRRTERPLANSLDLSNYLPGTYIVEIVTNKNTYTQKIIKL